MNEQRNIPEIFEAVVERVATSLGFPVYFDYGAYDIVNKNLVSKKEAPTYKEIMYPLVWLITPFREDKPIGRDYVSEADFDILILKDTDPEKSHQERNSLNFIPTLRPIYRELLRKMDDSYQFGCLSANGIPHEVKEWPYHSGREDLSGKQNLFNDYIDCIQIRRMKLQVNHSTTFVNA